MKDRSISSSELMIRLERIEQNAKDDYERYKTLNGNCDRVEALKNGRILTATILQKMILEGDI